jgi:DNA-binding CsgD family transcriptional regulator
LPSLIIRDAELYGEAIIEDLPAYTHLADVLATAVALVWGCSFIYSPRTFQEMISIAHPIASKNKVLQAANKYVFTRLVTASPRMFENKQYTNLVNYYIEHFGAVLNIPYRTVLTAKERFKHLQYKQYTIKPDLQSIAFLLSTYTQKHQTSLKTFKDTVSAIRGYNKGHIMRSLIVECLAKESLTIKQIADKLNRSYQTIYYHIQKLKVLDILETSKVKNAKGRKVTNFTIRTDDKVPLDWKEVTSKCFVSKRSVTRLIKEIQTDVKKTLLHRKPLVTVNHSHSYYHS